MYGDAETFARVKQSLRRLRELRYSRRSSTPHLTVSFTIGDANYDQLDDMVEAAAEGGADGAFFQHVFPVTRDARTLEFTEEQLAACRREVPRATARRASLGLETNLRGFAVSRPRIGATPRRSSS